MAKPLILVVDDEPGVADNLVGMIKKWERYDALAAYSGKSAFEALEKNKRWLKPNRISLILLDIKMPEMDGLQFLEKMRGLYDEENIGIIMVTAYEDEEKWDRATSGFIVKYLKKPVDEKELKALIDQFYSDSDARYTMTVDTFKQHIKKIEEYRRAKKATA